MSELLTHDEYRTIAAGLTPPTTAFVDGAFRRAGSGATFDTINPATGEVLAAVAACDATDVDFAVGKAREAFDEGRWRCLHPSARKQVLIRLAKLIRRNRHELAVLESLDSGKPVRDCAEIDLPETINTLIWHAEAIDKLYDQTAPVGEDALALVVREPIGVVGAILPWNFPLLMMAWKIGPALAAGCSVIVKPAEQTSLTALRVAELAMEAGVPNGVLNVVTGTGPDAGAPIGLHPDVDMVSFTGSTETGRRFLRYAADSNLKKVVLECGGKNPAIVMDDAENLDLVAEHLANGAFWNMGENCSATSRLIVHEDVRDALLPKLLARVRDWRMGDPLDPTNHLGCLIDGDHCAKVSGYLAAAGKDVTKLVGGEVEGNFVSPTILDRVAPDSALATEEIFGPVLSVITVKSLDEAIAIANDSVYGLAASVFTANAARALRAARAIRAGTVTVNCYGEGDLTTPFGGYRQSGFGGRDNGLHAHDQYCEIKTIWVDLSDRQPEEGVDG
ncbi:aldehyde dehydrogenase [Alphaproteobacteria bacterium LSUCC0719]